MKNKLKGVNVLICGSQKFDDEFFVHSTLETLYTQTNGHIRKIFTSKFAGSCEFARTWVEQKNDTLPVDERIEIVDFFFDGFLEKKNQSLYDNLEIPAFAVKHDPFFQQGKEMITAKGVNLVISFPNKEGILGASTRNVCRFAALADIQVFDTSNLLAVVNKHREEAINNQAVNVVEENVKEEKPSLGFNNRHPLKR